MTLSILANTTSMFALRNVQEEMDKASRSSARASAGERIITARDDAAGFAISERLRVQVNGLRRASQNQQEGISLVQTAEGGLLKISEILHRLRTLAVQASNGVLTSSDRAVIQAEVGSSIADIDLMVSTVHFNNQRLLDGSHDASNPFSFQVGANRNELLDVSISDMGSTAIGIDALDVSTMTSAESALSIVDDAIEVITAERGRLGAFENRLAQTGMFLGISAENQEQADSNIRDADLATEIVDSTLARLKVQVGMNAVSQASSVVSNLAGLLG